MQRINLRGVLAAAAVALVASAAVSARAADVGVSVSISQPGVYGRVDIGRFPQPTVFVSQPTVVLRQPVAAQPVYMWVPPGHRKNWRRHCSAYNACGVPVYFVRDDWYQQRVMVPYRNERGHERHEERRDERGHDRGHGHDNGRGEGHGKGHRD